MILPFGVKTTNVFLQDKDTGQTHQKVKNRSGKKDGAPLQRDGLNGVQQRSAMSV